MTVAGLAAEQRRAFARDGVVWPVEVLSSAEAADIVREIEAIERTYGGTLNAFLNVKPHLLVPLLWHLVNDPRIVEPIASLLGPDLCCLGSSLIDKPAGSRSHVAWHQDATFWGLSRPVAATAWLALTPSTRESGCVQALPGTHGYQRAHEHSDDATNMLGARERVSAPLDLSPAVDITLAPGEMSIHHPLLMHGSMPNTATRRRAGFAIRYIPSDVVQENGTVTSIRGRTPPAGVMHLEQEPEGLLHADALRRHAGIVRRSAAVIRGQKRRHLDAVARGRLAGDRRAEATGR